MLKISKLAVKDTKADQKIRNWNLPVIDPNGATGFLIYSWINICFTVSIFLVPYILATDIDYMMN